MVNNKGVLVLFSALFALNCFLSYGPSEPRGIILAVLLLGIFLGFYLKLPRTDSGPATRDFHGIISPPPAWIWAALGAMAVFARLTYLTTLSTWPLIDEGFHGFFASEVSEKNQYRFFYTYAQSPPFYIWGLGLFFKAFGISLSSLWLFPALLSLITCGVSYWAAGKFFPKPVAFLIFSLTALGFWPLFSSRFSHAGGLVLLWTFLTLGTLGAYWKEPEGPGRLRKALALGLALGLGFYTFTSWPIVAAWILLTLAWGARGGKKGEWKLFGYITVLALLCLLPLLYGALREDFGSYLAGLFSSTDPNQSPVSFLSRLRTSFSYFSVLFWGASPLTPYAPVWGGFLNPILGSLFFLGAFELFRLKNAPWGRWILLSVPVLLLPGLLTRSLEMFRIIQVLPFLLVIVAFGFLAFLSGFSGRWKVWILALLLLSSAAWDWNHLSVYYPRAWAPGGSLWQGAKSPERFRAFQILDKKQKADGPGLILTEFAADTLDQTLTVATTPFNAARNRRLDAGSAKWAAILTNVHFQPYLQKRFPDASWSWLAADLSRLSGGLMLGVIPLTEKTRPTFSLWSRADGEFREVSAEVLHQRWGQSQTEILNRLLPLKPSLEGDPFLLSCYWQKVFIAYSSDGRWANAVQSVQNALSEGYPAAHFYNELGRLWEGEKEFKKAEDTYRKALGSVPNYTNASQNLARVTLIQRGLH